MNINITKKLGIVILIIVFPLIITACSDTNGTTETYTVSGKVIDTEGEGVEGITLHFSENFGSVETDQDGQWSKTGLEGKVEITPAKENIAVFDPENISVAEEKESILFEVLLTDEQLVEIENTYDSVDEKIEEIYNPSDHSASLSQIANEVEGLTGIKEVQADETGLFINFKNGGHIYWHSKTSVLSELDVNIEQTNVSTLQYSENLQPQNVVGNKKALIVSTISQNDYDENRVKPILDDIENILEEINFEVDRIAASEANVDFFKDLDEYGFVFMMGHGNVVRNLIGEDLTVFETGEKPDQIRFTSTDWLKDRICYGLPGTKVAITNKFIEDYCIEFNNSIILAHSCLLLEEDYMAKAFVNNGAQTFMGWTNFTGDNNFIMQGEVNFIETLAQGYNLGEAYNNLDTRLTDGFNFIISSWFGSDDKKGKTSFEFYPEDAIEARLVDQNNLDFPKLIYPEDQQSDLATSLTLSWEGSTDPDGVSITYDIYLDTNSKPTTKIGENISTTGYDVSGLSQNTTYYWKVVAKDDKGNSRESMVWEFTTKDQTDSPSTGFAVSSDSLYSIIYDDEFSIELIGSVVDNNGNDIMLSDIAINPIENLLYGITFKDLYQIDISTGNVSHIGSLSYSDANALDFNEDGQLYASTASGDFFKIDISTGSTELIGEFENGYQSSGDLKFLPDGRLIATVHTGTSWIYPNPDDELAEVDVETGTIEIIDEIGYDFVYGLTLLNGELYGGTNSGSLISIDVSTGRGSYFKDLGFSVMGMD